MSAAVRRQHLRDVYAFVFFPFQSISSTSKLLYSLQLTVMLYAQPYTEEVSFTQLLVASGRPFNAYRLQYCSQSDIHRMYIRGRTLARGRGEDLLEFPNVLTYSTRTSSRSRTSQ